MRVKYQEVYVEGFAAFGSKNKPRPVFAKVTDNEENYERRISAQSCRQLNDLIIDKVNELQLRKVRDIRGIIFEVVKEDGKELRNWHPIETFTVDLTLK